MFYEKILKGQTGRSLPSYNKDWKKIFYQWLFWFHPYPCKPYQNDLRLTLLERSRSDLDVWYFVYQIFCSFCIFAFLVSQMSAGKVLLENIRQHTFHI